ncbi:DUF5928 domain-containing protein [Celeribacter arenosi]|uniref:Peptide O-xylosyltransferase n=1 Tax=Celeribacter arenosi TaxID=792649 RepID=A0ABP7K5L1_9RHOB
MARIAFILLCHKDPQSIIAQANRLTAAGDYISIHFDARSGDAPYQTIRAALRENPNVTFATKRLKCGWGEWSLVQATLNAIEAAEDAFPQATHFYMVSGDCMSTKTAEYMHDFLDRQEADYIESFDFFDSDWIKTGIKSERLVYRHYFNERTHKKLFYASMDLQRKLGLEREIPSDIRVMIGSQWWCLRRETIEAILRFTRERRDVMRFFSTTWIPDETFFQTLVRHLVPEAQIHNRTLTFLMFTDYGMPVVFYNDHYDLLLSQDYLFARKISPDAHELKARLGDLYAQTGVEFQLSNEGRSLFSFLTERGRIGRRFAQRFWETENSLGRDRELLMVVCKKWHIAKRIVSLIEERTDIPCFQYLFNEQDTPLPDLGGIEKSLEKRSRHRRAWVRMLFEYHGAKRMVICLDNSGFDLIEDFTNDRAATRILEIDCSFTDDYLMGHAKRTGLAGDQTPPEALERLLPTIRSDIEHETDRIHDAGFENHERISETATPAENAAAVARFLGVDEATALEIVQTPDLFSD